MNWQIDMATHVEKHQQFMGTLRELGFRMEDPLDYVVQFEREVFTILQERHRSKEETLLVGSLADHTPDFGWASDFY